MLEINRFVTSRTGKEVSLAQYQASARESFTESGVTVETTCLLLVPVLLRRHGRTRATN